VVGARAYQHPSTNVWQSLGAFATWEMRLTVRPTRWSEIWLRATNLLDGDQQSKYGYPEPGRELWVGARASYDGWPARRDRAGRAP